MTLNQIKQDIPKHLVAVDLGSNSFHMVVAREQAGCIQVIHTHKERVHLADGLDSQYNLSQEAIDRGVACLEAFNDNFALGPDDLVRVVATYTLRKAVNRQEFIAQARKVFPFDVEVIDGDTEARLIYQGVAHTHPIRGHTIVVDIGGGSTEVILGAEFDVKQAVSLEVGSGVLSKQCFRDGIVTRARIEQAKAVAIKQLSPHVEHYKQLGWQNVVGTSGSIKVIAQAMQELFEDKLINLARLEQLNELFIKSGHYNAVALTTLDKQRLPQLPGAASILLALFELLEIETIEYCSSALREGVLYGLSESCQEFDPRHRTVNNLADLHRVDHDYARRVVKQLNCFYETLAKRGWILTRDEQTFIDRAAQLHEVGISINSKKRQVHGAYIIANSIMPGFNATEHQVIEQLVRNHRGRIALDIEDIGVPNDRMMAFIQLLRIAIILTRGRVPMAEHVVDMYFEPPSLVVVLTARELSDNALMNALDCEVEAQAKAGLTLVLNKFTTEH